MEVNIKQQKKAVLFNYSCNSKAFDSPSDRNKFFAGLHGRKQIVRRKGGEYIYRRKGLLDVIPHIKVDDSVFIVARENAGQVVKFFEEWQEKIEFKQFIVLLGGKELKKIKSEKRSVRIE